MLLLYLIMKIHQILLLFFISFSCNANKNLKPEQLNITKPIACPEDGVCTFQVLKNKTYTIKKDEFGNSYSEILNGKKTVLKFEYKRNELKGVQDSSYRELIYVEIDPENLELNLTNENLQKANIGFERLCFCRGQTGSYVVTLGHLLITKIKENEFNITLDFKTDKVPQVITSINENFKL